MEEKKWEAFESYIYESSHVCTYDGRNFTGIIAGTWTCNLPGSRSERVTPTEQQAITMALVNSDQNSHQYNDSAVKLATTKIKVIKQAEKNIIR